MDVYIIDASNASTAKTELVKSGKYFIINADINTINGNLNIGAGSVLDFRGGSFKSSTSLEINLNGCPIIAGAYPIFSDNVKVTNLNNDEVRAEWFKWSTDTSDDQYITRALQMANNCPVVLQNKTYTLKNSIKFDEISKLQQTLKCPGTLQISNNAPNIDVPAIDINAQEVSIYINKIVGNQLSDTTRYHGIGILASTYSQHCNIEVRIMQNLNKGFCILPDTKDKFQDNGQPANGGMQYCRFKFGSISADYCFYIDVFSKARAYYYDPADKNKAVIPPPTDPNNLKLLKFTVSNWFSENQVYGGLMQGKYGIYTVDSSEVWSDNPSIDLTKVPNAMNGLRFDNISFEHITGLALRLRSINRSNFNNMQMFNSMPGPVGENAGAVNNTTPWIDLDNLNEVRMSFNSFVMPYHFKVGSNCKNSYVYGAVLDKIGHYTSHLDTLGIDTLYGNDTNGNLVQKSQMFLTNSIVPYNMAKNLTVDSSKVVKYIKDLMPNLKEGTTDATQIDLSVLPSTLNVDVLNGATLVLDFSGLDSFAPCLYTVNANIVSGSIQFRTTDGLRIKDDDYTTAQKPKGSVTKTVKESGVYAIQWLDDWSIQIKKV